MSIHSYEYKKLKDYVGQAILDNGFKPSEIDMRETKDRTGGYWIVFTFGDNIDVYLRYKKLTDNYNVSVIAQKDSVYLYKVVMNTVRKKLGDFFVFRFKEEVEEEVEDTYDLFTLPHIGNTSKTTTHDDIVEVAENIRQGLAKVLKERFIDKDLPDVPTRSGDVD